MTQASSRGVERVGIPLATTTKAARIGRCVVRRYLTEWRAADLIDAAQLVTSELVWNVVQHTDSPVAQLELAWHGQTLDIAISDSCTAPPPEPTEVLRQGGDGLRIVALLADDHGVTVHATGTTVWCTLSRAGVARFSA